MKILEFQTLQEAQDCLDFANQLASNYWQGLGYQVVNGKLTGKNASTNKNEPYKAKTTTWADIQTSPDQTYYFKSFSDTDFSGATQFLIDAGFNFVEKEKPLNWNEANNIGV